MTDDGMERQEGEGDAGLDAAPQGTSDEGRPDVKGDPDPEQADPESGPAGDQSDRSDAGHA